MLSSADRIAFSAQIVSAAAQVAGIALAQAALQSQLNKLQALDTANTNLFNPGNVLITQYQVEYGMLDGNGRTTIVEQDIVNAANRTFQNHFFPNDVNATVPSIVSLNNVWPRINPYALNYAIGKNYSEAYTVTPKEGDIINNILTFISSLSGYTDMELTTGETGNGMCSIITYTDQVTCEAHSGIWTPSGGTSPSTNIHNTLISIVSEVNALVSFLNTELTYIVSTDLTVPNQAQNQAAADYINLTFKPALATWLAYPDFEVTGSGPSKLHSTQRNALVAALNARLTFINTRKTQLGVTLGTISQNITTGDIISSSGYYGKRYSYLTLRLNVLGGSLSQLASAQGATGAQNAISANIVSTAAIYNAFLPTSSLQAPGNGTAIVHLVDVSFVSPGDAVFVVADNQQELLRAVRSITGKAVTLNDVVPANYTVNVRLYKDLT